MMKSADIAGANK